MFFVSCFVLLIVNLIDSWYKTTPSKYLYRIVLVGQATFTNGDPYLIPYVNGPRRNPPNSQPQPTPTPAPAPQPQPRPQPPVNPSPVPQPPVNPTPLPHPPLNPIPIPTNPEFPNIDLSRIPPEYRDLIPQIINNLNNLKPSNRLPWNSNAANAASADPTAAPIESGRSAVDAVDTQGMSGLLETFNRWHSTTTSLPKNRDNTQLFSGLNFASGVLGLANVGMGCNPSYAGSVTELNEPSDVANAVIAAHETGHTLGMSHDGAGSSCPQSGYIMAAVAGVGNTFSSCSISDLDRWSDGTSRWSTQRQCVDNIPSVWLSADPDVPAKSTGATASNEGKATIEPGRFSREESTTAPESALSNKIRVPSAVFIAVLSFAAGLVTLYAVTRLARRMRKETTPARTVAAVPTVQSNEQSKQFSLHIAPSAPSTPIANDVIPTHIEELTEPASPSVATVPKPHTRDYLTHAKRRNSLGPKQLDFSGLHTPASAPSTVNESSASESPLESPPSSEE
jgi:hypothetical protein